MGAEEASYRRALELAPANAVVHSDLGSVLLDQFKLEEAEASYRRALELDPELAEAHHNLGIVLRIQGKPDDEAKWHLQRAKELRQLSGSGLSLARAAGPELKV